MNLIAVFCILSWRIFWMTMMNRVAPGAAPTVELTRLETHLVDELFPDDPTKRRGEATLSCYLTKIARLGGPPPNTGIHRSICT